MLRYFLPVLVATAWCWPVHGATKDIKNIDIIVKKQPTGPSVTVQTDASGVFRVTGLEPGDYQIEAYAPRGATPGGGFSVVARVQLVRSVSNVRNNADPQRNSAKSREFKSSGERVFNDILRVDGGVPGPGAPLFTERITLYEAVDLTGRISSTEVEFSATSLAFQAVAGGPAPAPQSVHMTSAGGAVPYTATFIPQHPLGWSATLSKLCCLIPSGATETIQVTPLISGLPPGRYTGLVQVRLTPAGQPPSERSIVVTVDVYAPANAGQAPIQVDRTSFRTYLLGPDLYAPGEFTVTNTLATTQTFTVGHVTQNGVLRLIPAPTRFELAPGAARTVRVEAWGPGAVLGRAAEDEKGQKEKKECATVTRGDGKSFDYCLLPVDEVCLPQMTVEEVQPNFRCGPKPPPPPGGGPLVTNPAAACSPTGLRPTIISVDAVAVAGRPLAGRIEVIDNCGRAVTDYSATLLLGRLGSGPLDVEAFSPGGKAAGAAPRTGEVGGVPVAFSIMPYQGLPADGAPVTLVASVTAPNPAGGEPLRGATTTEVASRRDARAPVLARGGVLPNSSFESVCVSPGEMVSFFGSFPSVSFQLATALPLPTSMQGLSLDFNGKPVPLIFVSPTQISGIVPFGTPPGTHTLLARLTPNTGDAYTQTAFGPIEQCVVAANPALFSTDGTGSGQAHIYKVVGGTQLVNAEHPAERNEPLVMYVSGLGDVAGVPSGDIAPLRLLPVQGECRVEIAGQPAIVDYCGLTPGAASLYQINIRPQNLPRFGEPARASEAARAAAAAGVFEMPVVISVGGAKSHATATAWFKGNMEPQSTIPFDFDVLPWVSYRVDGNLYTGPTALNFGEGHQIALDLDTPTFGVPNWPGAREHFLEWYTSIPVDLEGPFPSIPRYTMTAMSKPVRKCKDVQCVSSPYRSVISGAFVRQYRMTLASGVSLAQVTNNFPTVPQTAGWYNNGSQGAATATCTAGVLQGIRLIRHYGSNDVTTTIPNGSAITMSSPATLEPICSTAPVQFSLKANYPDARFSITINGNRQDYTGDAGLVTVNQLDTVTFTRPPDPQTPAAGTRYHFYGWSGATADPYTLPTPIKKAAYAAYFLASYQLTIQGQATTSPPSPDGFYKQTAAAFIPVTVTGQCPGGIAPLRLEVSLTGAATVANVPNGSVVTMDAPKTVRVVCGNDAHVSVLVQANPPVPGLVAEIDGATRALPAIYTAPGLTTHTHSAPSPQVVAGVQYSRTGWTPGGTTDPQQVTLPATGAATYTVNFIVTGYAVDVVTNNCQVQTSVPGPFPVMVAPGSTFSLLATPLAGHVYQNSIVSFGPGSTPITVTSNQVLINPVSAPTTITVNCVPAPPPVLNLSLVGSPQISANTMTVTLRLTNTGGLPAVNVMTTSTAGGSVSLPITNPVSSLGTIEAGAHKDFTVLFVQPPPGPFNTGGPFNMTVFWTYTGGGGNGSLTGLVP